MPSFKTPVLEEAAAETGFCARVRLCNYDEDIEA